MYRCDLCLCPDLQTGVSLEGRSALKGKNARLATVKDQHLCLSWQDKILKFFYNFKIIIKSIFFFLNMHKTYAEDYAFCF